MLKATLAIAAATAAFIGACVQDSRSATTHYKTGVGFLTGAPGVYSYTVGGLFGGKGNEKLVGTFGGGAPRLVAFGCEGRAKDAVLIAIEESDLPRCDRIETIEGAPSVYWAR